MKRFILVDNTGVYESRLLDQLTYQKALEEAINKLGFYVTTINEQKAKELHNDQEDNK